MKVTVLSETIRHPDGTVTAFRNEDAIAACESEVAANRAAVVTLRFKGADGQSGAELVVPSNEWNHALIQDKSGA